MKVVVIGGSGLIGKKLVSSLRECGYEAIAASPSSGVNAVTGEGLAETLVGAIPWFISTTKPMMSPPPIVFPTMYLWLPEKDKSPNLTLSQASRDMVSAISKRAWHYVID